MKIIRMAVAIAAVGCGGMSDPGPQNASVRFQIDAPLCGSTRLSLAFSIDGVAVGTEGLKDRLSSQVDPVSPGSPRLTAASTELVTIQDTTVNGPGGKLVTDTVGVYCS